jgi:dTDP-4-amino-4,6-dideoxygalactose transaminase
MKEVKIQLSRPSLGHREGAAVADVLRSGYLGMGPQVASFEEELRRFLGGGVEVVCTNTGTAALDLAVRGVGLGPGDEVLVPSLTYVASFQAIAVSGATPVACDVTPATALLDLADAEKRVGPRTRAVMPVHYASAVGDLEAVYRFAERLGLRVIEDAAHAFGGRYRGHLVGSIGDVICFSFDPIKNITCGEGGAIASRDRAVIEYARKALKLGIGPRVIEGRNDVDVEILGWRYHMSDINAAIGRVQLSRFESELMPRRRALWNLYRRELSPIDGVELLAVGPDEEIVPHIFPVRILDAKRDAVASALSQEGYETTVHYKPNHLLSRFSTGNQSLPNAESLYAELLSLPLHPGMAESDARSIVRSVEAAVR